MTNLFLDVAETEAKEQKVMTMNDWIKVADDLLKYRNDVAIDNVDAKKIINQLWNYIWDLEDVEKGLIVPSEVRHVDFSDIKSKLFEYNLIAGKYQKESGKSLLLSK